jgi:hypothetical protein
MAEGESLEGYHDSSEEEEEEEDNGTIIDIDELEDIKALNSVTSSDNSPQKASMAEIEARSRDIFNAGNKKR